MRIPNIIVNLAIAAGLAGTQITAHAAPGVESKKAWTERFELTTDSPRLEIRNIWGDVRVQPGPEGEITIAVSEHRSAPDQERFDRSLDVYGLEVESAPDGVAIKVGHQGQSWYRRDPCRGCRAEYQFEVRVPPDTRLHVSTVNDGIVEVSGVHGPITAGNVNGPVSIFSAHACESVESVNGDILLGLPGGAGLDLQVDLFNGRIRSEVPVDPLAIPARVQHEESNGRHQYRIEQYAGLRLAGGGPVFNVTSLNGDFRIQKTR